MTKTGYKILSGCLCAALICTITGASVHAENGALHAPQDTKAASAAAEERASKEETVYVIAGADGKQQSVIVSDWLKKPEQGNEPAGCLGPDGHRERQGRRDVDRERHEPDVGCAGQ